MNEQNVIRAAKARGVKRVPRRSDVGALFQHCQKITRMLRQGDHSRYDFQKAILLANFIVNGVSHPVARRIARDIRDKIRESAEYSDDGNYARAVNLMKAVVENLPKMMGYIS